MTKSLAHSLSPVSSNLPAVWPRETISSPSLHFLISKVGPTIISTSELGVKVKQEKPLKHLALSTQGDKLKFLISVGVNTFKEPNNSVRLKMKDNIPLASTHPFLLSRENHSNSFNFSCFLET